MNNINYDLCLSNLIGKRLHYHTTWAGSGKSITIGHMIPVGDSIMFTETIVRNQWIDTIYVPYKYLEELVKNGKVEHHLEVDHCTIVDTWEITL